MHDQLEQGSSACTGDSVRVTSSRTIRLRRPAVISMHETPFVPKARVGMDIVAEVDRRWAEMCSKNPSLHDGRMSHVLGVHRNGHGGASIHTMDCAYRFYAVQDASLDLGVRHLGVKAITMHDGMVLLGKRSQKVCAYPGMWEFAPGGVIEPGRDPVDVLRSEYEEETGLVVQGEPAPIAVIFDSVIRCWEIIYRTSTGSPQFAPCTDEYVELQWCELDRLPEPLSPPSRQIAVL